MTQRRRRIPGIPADAERTIDKLAGDLDGRLKKLERKPGRAQVVIADAVAHVGEFLNIEGTYVASPGFGTTIILPEPTAAIRGDAVGLNFRNSNRVRIVSLNGLVNGIPAVISNARGSTIAICNGLDGWELSQSITVDGVVGAPGTPLANLAGLSVLGRAPNSLGAMAAITASTGDMHLVSNAAGTMLEWVTNRSQQFDDTVTGVLDPYLLPAAFKSGDSLVWVITGNVTLNRIRMSDDSVPPDGTVLYLSLRDQSGGVAPGHTLTLPDTGAVTSDGSIRTPGQVQGTSPGPSYVMQSEEEGCILIMRAGNWRLLAGTAAQAITGDITVASGNGSTRTAAITANVIVDADVNTGAAIAQTKLGATTGFSVKASGSAATTSAEPIVTYSASANMSAERVTTSSTSITVSTGVASQIEFQRAALTGDVTASANSNTTAIAPGVIVDADVNAAAAIAMTKTGALTGDVTKASGSDVTAIAAGVIVNADVNAGAGIALSKLENIGANQAIGTTTSGTVPTAIAVASDTGMASIGEGPTSTGYGAQSRDNMARWLDSQTNVRVFEEEFQGNLVHHIGGESRFSIVSGLAGIALSTLANSTGEYTGALNLSTAAGTGTTRGTYTLGANESAFNFHWNSLRYFSVVFRARAAAVANTHFALGLVGPFASYAAATLSPLAGVSEGIFIEGVTALSANLRVGRRTGSATSTTDTGVVIADNRFQYEFFRTAAGADYHYLNGVLIRTDSSGIAPTGTACTFFYTILGTTTAERAIELDHLKVVLQSSNRYT